MYCLPSPPLPRSLSPLHHAACVIMPVYIWVASNVGVACCVRLACYVVTSELTVSRGSVCVRSGCRRVDAVCSRICSAKAARSPRFDHRCFPPKKERWIAETIQDFFFCMFFTGIGMYQCVSLLTAHEGGGGSRSSGGQVQVAGQHAIEQQRERERRRERERERKREAEKQRKTFSRKVAVSTQQLGGKKRRTRPSGEPRRGCKKRGKPAREQPREGGKKRRKRARCEPREGKTQTERYEYERARRQPREGGKKRRKRARGQSREKPREGEAKTERFESEGAREGEGEGEGEAEEPRPE
jgi:hypothetical protein